MTTDHLDALANEQRVCVDCAYRIFTGADLREQIQALSDEVGVVRRIHMDDVRHFEAVCRPLYNSTLWSRLRWVLLGPRT